MSESIATTSSQSSAPSDGRLKWIIDRLVIAIPFIWLIIFFLIPFFIVIKISFSEVARQMPPYNPVFNGFEDIWQKISQFTTYNYEYLWKKPLYLNAYLASLQVAFFSTLMTLLIGYPIAYGMARAPLSVRPTLLMLVILPFLTSFLIRVYAWIGILKPEGLLNSLLMFLGIIDAPLNITNTYTAVYIGLVYSYLPFMILPIYSALEKMDYTLIEAAQDLGCKPTSAFWKVTFPLSIPGVIAGCFLVFIPVIGEFVIPELLGGNNTIMIGKALWTEFNANRDWPISSAVAVILLIILIVPIVIFQWLQARQAEASK
ncbi:MAG: ABC transporter permease subunit [Rhizobiaceae bacterium]